MPGKEQDKVWTKINFVASVYGYGLTKNRDTKNGWLQGISYSPS